MEDESPGCRSQPSLLSSPPVPLFKNVGLLSFSHGEVSTSGEDFCQKDSLLLSLLEARDRATEGGTGVGQEAEGAQGNEGKTSVVVSEGVSG